MQLHQLKSSHKRKPRKIVGRGGKRGTYSGRGMKGQNSRSGSGSRPGFAGGQTPFFRRLPKQRGATKKMDLSKDKKLKRYQLRPVVLNLATIDNYFKAGETVSPGSLLDRGLINKINDRVPAVKILGHGKLSKKLIFDDCIFSKTAAKKVA